MGDMGSEMSALARDFCAFMVRASGLQSKLEAFMEQKCKLFEAGSLLEEQKLEWTLLHKEYLEIAEQEMEDFLTEKNAKAEEVAMALQKALGKSLWSLPLLRSLDYECFAAQMIARASWPQIRMEARSSSGVLGGVWRKGPGHGHDCHGMERFLKAQGVPWILRRLHIFAEICEICVVEMPGTVPIFTLLHAREHGFGVSQEQVVADGTEHQQHGFTTKAWLEEKALHILTRCHGDGDGAVVQTCYSVQGNSLQVQSSASQVAPTLIDGGWSVTQSFLRTEDARHAPSSGAEGDEVIDKAEHQGYAAGCAGDAKGRSLSPELPRVPTPLMPCAPAGPPTRQPVARRRFRAPA